MEQHFSRTNLSYDPLPVQDHLRILTLQPGEYDDAIICSLKSYHIDHAPDYSAISYVWGNQAQLDPIVSCDGCTKQVGENLMWGLCRTRQVNEPVTLWIDALCIDQSNVSERSAQVRQMLRIFQTAKKVLIWLGPDPNDVGETVIPLLQKLEQLARDEVAEKDPRTRNQATSTPGSIKSEYMSYQRYLSFNNMPPAEDPVWDGLATFADNEWSQRTWIVQEASTALLKGVVYYGPRAVEWNTVGYASMWLLLKRVLLLPQFKRISSLARTIALMSCIWRKGLVTLSRLNPEPLCVAMHEYRLSKCADPLDKVYAILAISMEGVHCMDSPQLQTLLPDYTRSVLDLFCNVARVFMLSPFAHQRLYAHRMPILWTYFQEPRRGWPSWVPRWHEASAADEGHGTTTLIIAYHEVLSTASVSTRVRDVGNDQILVIHGTRVDTVSSTFNSLRAQGLKRRSWWETVRAIWINYSQLVSDRGPAGLSDLRSMILRFALTFPFVTRYLYPAELEGRTVGDGLAEQALPDFAAWYRRSENAAVERLKADGASEDEISSYKQETDLLRDLSQSQEGNADRYEKHLSWRPNIFCTSNGLTGAARARIQPGDVICLFSGCKVPVVLHPQDGHYIFYGLCHVPALLVYREAALKEGELEMQEEWFEIH